MDKFTCSTFLPDKEHLEYKLFGSGKFLGTRPTSIFELSAITKGLGLISFLCLFFSQTALAQSTVRGTVEVVENNALTQNFIAYDIYSIPMEEIMEVKRGADEFNFILKLGNKYEWNLNLVESGIMGPKYREIIGTANGATVLPPRENISFNGYLNPHGGTVALTIDDNWLMGFVTTPSGEKLYIEPLSYVVNDAPVNYYLVYKSGDVVSDPNVTCGAIEVNGRAPSLEEHEMHLHDNDAEKGALAACHEVDFAIASTFDMINAAHNSAALVMNHVISITTMMDAFYNFHTIDFIITDNFVAASSAADPLTPNTATNNVDVLLPNFMAWAQGAGVFGTHDLGQMWTSRNIVGCGDPNNPPTNTGLIGCAYIGAVCGSFRYNVCEDFAPANISCTSILSAHEIGHNFNALHSDAGTAPNNIMNGTINCGATGFGPNSMAKITAYTDSPSGACLTACNAPANDLCDNAIAISCGQTIAGTTVDATFDNAGTCTTTNTAPGVWYTITGTGGQITLSTCNQASYDTKISVYTGTCAALTCVGGNDDGPGCVGFTSSVTVCTTVGQTYRVLVHGFGTSTGTFSLTATCLPTTLTLTCPPTATVSCTAPAPFATFAAFQAAGGSTVGGVAASFTFVTSESVGSCPTVVSRTYQIADPCGNTTTCSQVINVVDNTPPVITCPPNITVECNESTQPVGAGGPSSGTATGTAVATLSWPDSGAGATGLVGSLTAAVAGAPPGATITDVNITLGIDHSWVGDLNLSLVSPDGTVVNFLDNTVCPTSGNTDNVNVTFDDQGAAFNCSIVTNNTSGTTAALNCTGDYLTNAGVSGTMQPEMNSFAVFNTENPNGNWILNVTDDVGGDGGCVQNFVVSVSWTAPGNGMGTGTATATDNCTTAPTITFSDVSTQGMGCSEFSYTIIRTWTATDACGNAAACSQIITVEDNNPPTITCPANVTVQCDQPTTPATTGTATATGDNCATDAQLTVTFTDVSTQTPGGCGNDSYTITRTWTATDPCGNAVTCNQIITVEDTTPPTIVCPADVTIECDESTAPANTGTAVAIDACAPAADITITFADVSTQAAAGCGNDTYTITRTWTATDPCGNATNCVQVISVEDTTPPVIVCPANVSLSCTDNTDPANTGIATGSDNCSTVAEVVITSSDITTEGTEGCAKFTYNILRTWTATDACGNATTCVQSIDVADTEPPVITCPPSQTLTCFETVPTPFTNAADFIAGGGTISDNCTSLLTDFTVFVQNDDNGGDNCPGNSRTVVRTYFVSDACGNISTCTQTFTYLASTQGPVITSVLPTCYKYCADLANPMEEDITFTTDCSFGATVNIAGPQQIGATNCPGTIYRFTYTVTDDCGRTSTPVTRDFIIGNDGPTIQCPPFNLILECGDANNADYIAAHIGTVTANTSCDLGVTITHFPSNFNNITCNTATVVTFVATDACGRTASCTTTIDIMDSTAPEITSTYVDGVCNEAICGSNVSFWFNAWKAKVLEGLSATDACDSNVTFTTVGPNSAAQNCPDGTAETVITWVANDNCGNQSEISYSFYVVPANDPAPQPSIMGMIATEETETVEDVTVTLTGNNSATNVSVTEADGLYGFENLVLDNNYTVTPYSNENPLNGVTSYDLVLISKHVLQLQALDSPYKMIAADVNKSGSITTMDLVELRKLILHIDENFANNTSWRFVEAAYVFPQPNNPFASLFPEVTFINGLTADEQHDFVGVKIGDVNGSAIANALAGAEDRTVVGDLVFNVEDRKLKAGETVEVAFRAENFDAIHGYQFTLNFDESALAFADVRSGDLANMNTSNFGLTLLDKGVVTTSWTNDAAQSLVRDANVFYVSFTAKANVLLSEAITVSSRYTKAEAYNGNLDLMDVELRFNESDVVTKDFRLYQNVPNPFKQETVIGFDLPESGKATLNIYDVSGRMLEQIAGDFAKGYNTIDLPTDQLTPGLLHYQLVTPWGTAVHKMIHQK